MSAQKEVTVSAKEEVFVKMAVSAWETQNARVTKLLHELSDEQLFTETAPGRNRGIYLIGHLAAVSDAMITLLGWGERQHPELDAIFVKSPDKSTAAMPSATQVREFWTSIYSEVNRHITQTTPEQWFSRHTAVTPEDFLKEPFRNKLNVLVNRTNHMSYHLGQLIYLVKK